MLFRFDPSFLSYLSLSFELLCILVEPGVMVFFVFVLVFNGACLSIVFLWHPYNCCNFVGVFFYVYFKVLLQVTVEAFLIDFG